MINKTSFYLNLREDLIGAANDLSDLEVEGTTSGNLSVRAGDKFLITPSSVNYSKIQAADLVLLNITGATQAKNLGHRPSSEWQLHRDLYRARKDIGAVVHTHSEKATALSCLRREIPAFHYMVGIAGGHNIRCAPYATFGTQELSDVTLVALDKRLACLLSNHGVITVGENVNSAIQLAKEVELLASQYLTALSIEEPELLSLKEMKKVIKKFSNIKYREDFK